MATTRLTTRKVDEFTEAELALLVILFNHETAWLSSPSNLTAAYALQRFGWIEPTIQGRREQNEDRHFFQLGFKLAPSAARNVGIRRLCGVDG